MDITPQISDSLKMIQSYKGDGFRVNGEVFSGAIIVMTDRVMMWDVQNAAEPLLITPELQNLAGHIDVLLIGAGKSVSFLNPQQRAVFRSIGFSVDVMDTAAACRTYNVLAAEGRRVAAALIPVTP